MSEALPKFYKPLLSTTILYYTHNPHEIPLDPNTSKSKGNKDSDHIEGYEAAMNACQQSLKKLGLSVHQSWWRSAWFNVQYHNIQVDP